MFFVHGVIKFVIAPDAAGNLYLAAISGESWDGDGGATPLHTHSGGDDFTVLKLDSSGALQCNTFMGSSVEEHGNAIAVDDTGRALQVHRAAYQDNESDDAAGQKPGNTSTSIAQDPGSEIRSRRTHHGEAA